MVAPLPLETTLVLTAAISRRRGWPTRLGLMDFFSCVAMLTAPPLNHKSNLALCSTLYLRGTDAMKPRWSNSRRGFELQCTLVMVRLAT